jgi:hypothetical protein
MDINNILYIVILLVIVLLVCLKTIDLHNNLMNQPIPKTTLEQDFLGNNKTIENFEEDTTKEKMLDALGKVYNVNDKIEDAGNSDGDRAELLERCKNLGKTSFGSIVSKYSGKTINVEKEPNSPAGKTRYIIKWEPLGGKPGGCITANADGSYSTPICNNVADKQLWEIIEVKDEEQFTELIKTYGGEDRLKMGRPLDETSYPFHICKSSKQDFVLNYEGGGLSVRKLANYDSQKWDVSTESIAQDPMPTQNYNKLSSLTPGHNLSKSDMSASTFGKNMNNNMNGSENIDGVNFNINVEPELLKQLLGNDNSGNEYGENNNEDDFYINQNNSQGIGRGMSEEDVNSMFIDRENCSDCGDIPERFIRKDLVKSMCPGCDKLNNVKTE